jgi:hypothetical protein
MGPALAIVGIGLGVASYIQGQDAAKKQQDAANASAEAQRQQAALQQRQADINNARQIRAAARQSRIAQAVIANTGANAGTSNSTGVVGGMQSVEGQNRANIAFFDQMKTINAGITGTQIAQADANVQMAQGQSDAYQAAALGNLGGTLFKEGNGFKSIFGDQTNKT